MGKLAFGRLTPTLCVLLVGVPAAYLLGRATTTLTRDTGDVRWWFAGIGLIALAAVAGTIGTALRGALDNDTHTCAATVDGSCVVCGDTPTTPTIEPDECRGIVGRWPHERPLLHRVGRVV